MSAKTPTAPPNPIVGPARPPGFTGLRRWTDLRFVAPLLLIAGAVWMFTQPLAITQPGDARNAPDTGTTVVDSARTNQCEWTTRWKRIRRAPTGS